MIRRPPRSTQGVSSAASDVYKRQVAALAVVAVEVAAVAVAVAELFTVAVQAQLLVADSVAELLLATVVVVVLRTRLLLVAFGFQAVRCNRFLTLLLVCVKSHRLTLTT